MPLVGIGVDIVEIARINRLRKRFGQRFLNRLFAPEEIEDCLAGARPDEHFAARFAAKEAFRKAAGGQCCAPLPDITVLRNERGAPYLDLRERAAEFARENQVARVFCSLSHDGGLAIATVILEKD
jgi:holo-[acyl-carrier protein] synthase